MNANEGMLGSELAGLRKDRETSMVELDTHRKRYADELLNGGVGEDMMSILNGEKKVEVKNSTKRRYWLIRIINRIFNAI